MQSLYRDAQGVFHHALAPDALAEAVRERDGILWVDIDSTQPQEHAVLERLFGFHPLSVEDTLNPASRVKVEEYDNYLFVNVRVVKFCESTPDPYDLETVNLYLFITPSCLVTVHAEPVPSVAAVAALVMRSPDVLARGPARVAHLVLDAAIDAYFPVIDQVDDFIDGLEERVFETFDRTVLREIFEIKRTVISLRRYLAPQREVFNVLTNRPIAFVSAETQLYFRDVYDHMLRITEALDNSRDLLSSTLDSYLSQVSNRLGEATKALAVVATLSVPFVVVAGIYGMNVSHIPLATSPHAFWTLVAIQFGVTVVLLGVFRWKRWL